MKSHTYCQPIQKNQLHINFFKYFIVLSSLIVNEIIFSCARDFVVENGKLKKSDKC